MSRRRKSQTIPPSAIMHFAMYNPSGMPTIFPGTGLLKAPDGWLIADGSVVLAADYPELYEAIGTYYGSGGAGTFALPDLRGVFIRCWGASAYDPGRSFGSYQDSTYASHQHSINIAHSHTVSLHTHWYTSTWIDGGNGSIHFEEGYRYTTSPGGSSVSPTYDQIGGNVSESRPTNVAMLPCIKY